jgi:predicted ABC-type ATPase
VVKKILDGNVPEFQGGKADIVVDTMTAIEDIIPDVSDIVPYPYSKINNDEYEEIIERLLEKIEGHYGEPPVLFHMGGIPGSGKTTYYVNNKDSFPGYIWIGFDHVMDKISGYRRDNERLGSVESYELWCLPARVVGYELLLRAIKKGVNIFFDHGGLCKPHLSLMKNLKRCGYITKMRFLECDFEVAYARTLEREKVTHRHTPRTTLEERFKLVEDYKKWYSEIVDEFVLAKS